MRGRARRTRLIAAMVAAALVCGSAYALVVASEGGRQKAPGLTDQFERVDRAYAAATQEFVRQAKGLDQADLAETIRLYSLVLQAATTARDEIAGLPAVDETRAADDRMEKALRVQVLALTTALEAVRNRDEKGAAEASKQFEIGVLAYQVARRAMQDGLASCGDRCT